MEPGSFHACGIMHNSSLYLNRSNTVSSFLQFIVFVYGSMPLVVKITDFCKTRTIVWVWSDCLSLHLKIRENTDYCVDMKWLLIPAPKKSEKTLTTVWIWSGCLSLHLKSQRKHWLLRGYEVVVYPCISEVRVNTYTGWVWNEKKCRCFRPLVCTMKAELGRGTAWANECVNMKLLFIPASQTSEKSSSSLATVSEFCIVSFTWFELQ